MGTGTLPTAVGGTVIPEDDHNALKNAFQVDIVPRNSSDVAADLAGSLGQTTLRWLNGYFQKLLIGAVVSDLTIEESSGDLIFKVGGVTKLTLNANGLNLSTGEAATLPHTALNFALPEIRFAIFATTQNWEAPAGVDLAFIFANGAGGSGGSGASDNATGLNGGGGGGGGVMPEFNLLVTTPGADVVMTIAVASSGGNPQTGVNNGQDGANGGTTTVSTGGFALTYGGGNLGGKGTVVPVGGAGTPNVWAPTENKVGSGAGGSTGVGIIGTVSRRGAAGAAGGSSGSAGGGGGGGGGYGAGGAGGAGATAGGTGGTNGGIGAGGGGGGGSGVGGSGSGGGGNGGPGQVIIIWVDNV